VGDKRSPDSEADGMKEDKKTKKPEMSLQECNEQLEELKRQIQEMKITTTAALAEKNAAVAAANEEVAKLQKELDAETAKKDLAAEAANVNVGDVALKVAAIIADSKTNAAKIANGDMKAAAKTSGEKDANARIAELIAKMDRMNQGEIQLGFGICEGKDSNNINNWTTITSIKSFKKGDDITKINDILDKYFTPNQKREKMEEGGTKKNKPNQKSDKKQTKKNKKKK
jgi:hypothetical protein